MIDYNTMAGSKQCDRCWQAVPAAARFCSRCGREINAPRAAAKAPRGRSMCWDYRGGSVPHRRNRFLSPMVIGLAIAAAGFVSSQRRHYAAPPAFSPTPITTWSPPPPVESSRQMWNREWNGPETLRIRRTPPAAASGPPVLLDNQGRLIDPSSGRPANPRRQRGYPPDRQNEYDPGRREW